MKTDKDKMTEKILNLTLEIICLLTGEDYTVVKRTSGNMIPSSCSSGKWGGIQRPILKAPPHLLIHEKRNKQKILELTYKIIELLTGEVPVRCQDVTVHFSTEEREYFEGHKYLYKDIISPVGVGRKAEELDTCAQSQSYLKDEDGEINGNVQGIAEESNSYSVEEVAITTTVQYPSITIEKPPCDGRNLSLSNDPVDCTMCGSPHFIDEPCSCNEGNFANQPIYTLMDQMPQYISTHIKEEPITCDGGNLTDPNIYTPNTQDHSTTYIKEEQTTSDDHLTDPNSYTITDHGQYIFALTKKEPLLNKSETLTDLNIYTPTDHTQYQSSHTKEEPDSCHGENIIEPNSFTSTDHTQQYPTTHIKEEQALCDDNLRDTNSYTLTDHTQQYPITKIKEEQALCEEDLTYNTSSTTTEHTKYLFSHIKKEPVSSNDINSTDLTIHATYVSNKPDLYDGEHLTNHDSTTSTEHTQQNPTKEETVLENVSALQKQEFFSPGKPLENKKEPEQNHNDISASSKKYFCTIQQTTYSLEILYNCPECPESFTSNLDLAKHQIIHTGDSPFICSICGRCFGKKSDLITHQATHGKHIDFACPHCDLSFATKSSLSIHEKTHVQKKLLPCPECGKTFPTKKRLTGHQQVHTDERPFKCTKCGDTFKRKAHLQKHQTIHEKAKQQLTCHECGELFRNEVELNAHERVHENKKVFKCSDCGVCLTDRLELLKHQVKHSRSKPYQCSVNNSVHHRLHIFQCPECPKCFNSKTSLQMHQRIHASGQSMAAPYLKPDLSKDSISSPLPESFTEDQ